MEDGELEKVFLLLDAASPLVQTGLWRGGNWLRRIESREEAGRSLFSGVAEILRTENITLDSLGGFLFCHGPGSMLGIRIAAMAINGWQTLLPKPIPVFSYSSHAVLAQRLITDGAATPFHVISDARRQRWNVTSVHGPDAVDSLQRLSNDELAALQGDFYRMEEIVRGEPPVAIRATIPYDLEAQPMVFLKAGLLQRSASAEPLVQEGPVYQKWSAERHR